MVRRITSVLLALALMLPPAIHSARAADDGELFTKVRSYTEQFADVEEDSWYYDYVVLGYEYGLFDGRGSGFAPDAEITLAELVTLSARLRAAYDRDIIPAAAGRWYMPYVNYLNSKAALEPSLDGFDRNASRAQLAAVFAASLPETCYDGRNTGLVEAAYASGLFITDVGENTPYAAQILKLYDWGLLGGVDRSGSYLPDKTTTRAETAAIVMRIVLPALRLTLDWSVPAAPPAADSLAALETDPGAANTAPAFDDKASIDALVRSMLSRGEYTIELSYPSPITKSEASALALAFSGGVKRYCEQMYNSVECQYYLNNGRVILFFYASCCMPQGTSDDPQARENAVQTLAEYRDAAFARALEIREELWSSGALNAGMSQREIARVYYKWLCDHCVYDKVGAQSNDSISHIAYSALINGSAVCDGYTGAYNLFLRLEGIDCHAVTNNTHIWTVAILDGVEYHIDVTWGDQNSYIEWDYFAMDAARSESIHKQ
ncbi:MAG: S-layer homology domain-containing protein [Oscillospiraceae bacterium]|nr:S-layer homology domain-containing protein [Oscillospiraceae bacterium]